MRHASETPTALAERAPLPCHNPYDLLGPVRILRRALALTPNDLAVLTALVSFLPREGRAKPGHEIPALTVVFPSNASLSERANGLDERTLRRCLVRLTSAGLIERKNSANGKRFPLRYGGVIRDAFGIDLKPLIEQYASLATRASALTEDRERLRSLKAEALALRASLLHQERDDDARLATLEAIRNILRRATLSVDTVLQVISELRALGADAEANFGERQASLAADAEGDDHPVPALCSPGMPATNGQNVRHIESIRKEFKKRAETTAAATKERLPSKSPMNREPDTMAWEDYSHIAGFFPEAPRTTDALTRILLDLGRLLRIRQEGLLRGLKKAGAGKLLLTLDYLIGRSDAIQRPDAYFERMMTT